MPVRRGEVLAVQKALSRLRDASAELEALSITVPSRAAGNTLVGGDQERVGCMIQLNVSAKELAARRKKWKERVMDCRNSAWMKAISVKPGPC